MASKGMTVPDEVIPDDSSQPLVSGATDNCRTRADCGAASIRLISLAEGMQTVFRPISALAQGCSPCELLGLWSLL
jgi:hypothetical protein